MTIIGLSVGKWVHKAGGGLIVITAMFCPKCGSSQPDELRFCKQCGANLGAVRVAVDRPEVAEKFDWSKTWIAEMFMSSEEAVRRAAEIERLQRKTPEAKKITEVQGPLPSINYVNDRIFEYGRKLERWREIDAQSASVELSQEDTETMINCFVDLQKVLDGYNQLRSDMLRINTSSSSLIVSGEEVMELQKSDISFLESVCGKLLAPSRDELVDWENREKEADLPQLETLIERYTSSGEYEEVVQVWQRIPGQQVDRAGRDQLVGVDRARLANSV